MLEVLYHRAKFGWARIPGRQKRSVYLFVCLSIRLCGRFTLLNVRDCAPDFAMKALEYRNDFDTVGQGKACGCAPCSIFSDCRQLATPLNTGIQKNGKNV